MSTTFTHVEPISWVVWATETERVVAHCQENHHVTLYTETFQKDAMGEGAWRGTESLHARIAVLEKAMACCAIPNPSKEGQVRRQDLPLPRAEGDRLVQRARPPRAPAMSRTRYLGPFRAVPGAGGRAPHVPRSPLRRPLDAEPQAGDGEGVAAGAP